MKFEVTNPKAWKSVNEKNIPMSHKIKVYEKLGGAYRLGKDEGEQVFNKMTELLKHRMTEGDEKSPEETLDGLDNMTMGQLERIGDYANMILQRLGEGQKLSSWMYSQITLAVDQLNSVHDAMDGNDGEKEPVKEGDGLWANIRAKQARGEKPAHGNSDAHKDAVAAGKKINKEESVNEASNDKKRFMFDFYNDSNQRNTERETNFLATTLESAIKGAEHICKVTGYVYVEIYYKDLFLGSMKKQNGFKFVEGRGYPKFKSTNESVNEGVRLSLVDPNTNKFIKTLSLGRTYKEAEKEVETLNKRLSSSQKTKGLYWKVTSIGESVNEASLQKGKTYGGTKCEGGCYIGKQGLLKIIKISKESPNDVFMFRDDNFSGLQPHFIKDGVIAKATTINPSYDLEKHKVRNLNIGKDVIFSVRLFVEKN